MMKNIKIMNNGYELLSPGHSETKRNTDQQTCQWGLDLDQSLNQRSLETKVSVWDQVDSGKGVSDKVSAVRFFLGSGLFGSCNSY